MSDIGSEAWWRFSALSYRQSAWEYASHGTESGRRIANEWNECAEATDRAADALALVESAKGAEPLALADHPAPHGHYIVACRTQEAADEGIAGVGLGHGPFATRDEARKAFAAELIATALELVKP